MAKGIAVFEHHGGITKNDKIYYGMIKINKGIYLKEINSW